MMRISALRTGLACAAATGLLATGPAALAAGPETTVEHLKNVTETFVDVGPDCAGTGLYEITLTYNAVLKESVFDDGRVHATFTQTGTFEATNLGAGEDASGHVTIWGGFNANGKTVNGTFTFNVVGSFADGTRINTHLVDHFNTTPDGAEFFWTRCHD
jgi:hypothetical protein